MKTAMFVLVPLAALAGCATVPPANDGLSYARLGETVTVGGPRVTPLEVLEDSRCPASVTCVWAGTVRITARIDLGTGSETRELALGKPVPVADGTLELRTVLPPMKTPAEIPPGDYRFGFRFMGGL